MAVESIIMYSLCIHPTFLLQLPLQILKTLLLILNRSKLHLYSTPKKVFTCRPFNRRGCLGLWIIFSHIPADWETKRLFGMTTLSSEFLAQSTMPLRPFMGKLMSVITDTAGSLWMLATAEFKQRDQWANTDDQYTLEYTWVSRLENRARWVSLEWKSSYVWSVFST